MLGIFGIPFNVTYDLESDQIYAIAGSEALNMFDDEDLKKLFKGKLLLDGAAAAAATERGFGKYMGISASKKDFRFNREFNNVTGQPYSVTKDSEVPFIEVNADGVKVMTTLFYSPYTGSPELEESAPGTTFYRNELGGHVCVTAFHMNQYLSRYNEPRKAWLLEILDTLAEGKFPCAVLNEQKYLSLARQDVDGNTLMTIVNTGFDFDENIRIKYSGSVDKVKILTAKGVWEDVPFTFADGVITAEKTMMCYEYAVLQIS